jgi:hypothetical protein
MDFNWHIGEKMSEELNANDAPSIIDEEPAESPQSGQPAFTIVVQSWATPLLSIIMLMIGLLGGYFGRPVVESTQSTPTSDANPTSGSGTIIVPTPDVDPAAQQQELMAMIISETRHFQGNPDAPVTIIEFSDFK